jgi:glycosyltransferase involved in cell wall biosynthesis
VPKPNSILVVHNHYQKAGGEDEVFRAESAMLRSHGHTLHEYRVQNSTVDSLGKMTLLRKTIWNSEAHSHVAEAIETSQSEIAHFHNTVPLISPSAYYAARRQGAAVVQTLHNYRLLCPSATLFRNGQVCEECLTKSVPWPGVMHGCYRNSRVATAALAGMLTFHRAIGTWNRMVDVYIALTEFARNKFIEGGLPADRIVVKPNFTEDPGEGCHGTLEALFVGRLTTEKGVKTLLDGWRLFSKSRPDVRLKIIGTGPLSTLQHDAQSGVDWVGWQSHDQVVRLMQNASVLVFPSIHYEGFPMTLVEAFASGLPIVASRVGGIAELIRDGYTGRLYQSGDPADLCAVLTELFANVEKLRYLGRNGRLEYEEKYTPERNYEQLMRVYALATERARSTADARS